VDTRLAEAEEARHAGVVDTLLSSLVCWLFLQVKVPEDGVVEVVCSAPVPVPVRNTCTEPLNFTLVLTPSVGSSLPADVCTYKPANFNPPGRPPVVWGKELLLHPWQCLALLMACAVRHLLRSLTFQLCFACAGGGEPCTVEDGYLEPGEALVVANTTQPIAYLRVDGGVPADKHIARVGTNLIRGRTATFVPCTSFTEGCYIWYQVRTSSGGPAI
jgi:hypothetical protein